MQATAHLGSSATKALGARLYMGHKRLGTGVHGMPQVASAGQCLLNFGADFQAGVASEVRQDYPRAPRTSTLKLDTEDFQKLDASFVLRTSEPQMLRVRPWQSGDSLSLMISFSL